jgi:hypothetical protein
LPKEIAGRELVSKLLQDPSNSWRPRPAGLPAPARQFPARLKSGTSGLARRLIDDGPAELVDIDRLVISFNLER